MAVEIVGIFSTYISWHYYVFFYLICSWLCLYNSYITIANIYIIVFYSLFQDNIWNLTYTFLSGVQDFMHLLWTIVGHNIFNNYLLLVSLSTYMNFFRIYLAGFQDQTYLHLYFLYGSSYFSFKSRCTLLYKYGCYHLHSLEN